MIRKQCSSDGEQHETGPVLCCSFFVGKEVKMKKVLRRAALALAVVLGALALLFAGYVGYLQFQYYRIEDNLALEVASAPAETLAAGGEYTAVTCNLGFGAYGPDYSFFMDTGVMEDGTPTQGLYGKARSEEDVLANTTAALDALEELDADLLLLQEVDYDSHRSYFVDQRQMALDAFSDYGWIWGQNFHSGYLAYPLTDHHGVVNAGLLCLHLALGGFCFFASCLFNESRLSVALGAGVPVLFFLIRMLANMGGRLEKLKYATVFTLFDPTGLFRGDGAAYAGAAVLLALGLGFYALGTAVFSRRDLPL